MEEKVKVEVEVGARNPLSLNSLFLFSLFLHYFSLLPSLFFFLFFSFLSIPLYNELIPITQLAIIIPMTTLFQILIKNKSFWFLFILVITVNIIITCESYKHFKTTQTPQKLEIYTQKDIYYLDTKNLIITSESGNLHKQFKSFNELSSYVSGLTLQDLPESEND